MQIIPAIDILQGQVVHARPGARKDYLPIQSSLSDAAAPEAIIDALLDLFPFKIIYLADLDAIRERGSEVNKHLICRLLLKYPQISFWLDAGIDGPIRCRITATPVAVVRYTAPKTSCIAGNWTN